MAETMMEKRPRRKKGQHLTWDERLSIERMLGKGFDIKDIAAAIGCCLTTVYNEVKRARYVHTNWDLTETEMYCPDIAQNRYDIAIKQKGRKPKLLDDPEQLEYIGNLIIENDFSPKAALLYIQNEGKQFKNPVKSVNTIYAAIEKGYIDGLTLEMLPEGGRRDKERKSHVVRRKRAAPGKSIEERPEVVEEREEFGHWEMDTVIGKSTNRKNLLVLTERKSVYEIIEPLKEHTADEVRKALNRLEKRWGCMFYDIFKTITVDNGCEFSDVDGMEKALYRVGKRCEIYYCHARTPSERGTNEVTNRMVRRVFPKSADFDALLNRTAVKRCEEWINNYPRLHLLGRTAKQVFDEEVGRITSGKNLAAG